MQQTEPTKHLVARIREALAEDPRTNVLDLQVTATAGKVFLIGAVASEERKRAVDEVVREIVPEGTPVVNEVWVAHYGEPRETETERVP